MPTAEPIILDERSMVKAVIKGDDKAFEEFYKITRQRLERIAMGFLGDDPLVQDVLQETYVRALPKLKEFRFESSLCTWLTRFTINLCLQALTQRKKMLSTETNIMEGLMRKKEGRMTPEMRRMLKEEIESLDALSRRIVIAKDIKGLSFVEVAKKLKLPPGTVMSRLARARIRLRNALSKRGRLFKEVLESK